MNIFNRIIVIVLLLFLFLISIIGIVNIYANFFTWAEIPSIFLSSEVRMNKYMGTAVLAGILIVSIVILIFEFRRRPKSATISSDGIGNFMVTTDSISREIDHELMKLDEVKAIKAKTIVKRNGVFVDIYAKILEGQNLSQLAEVIKNTAYDFLTEKLALNVAKINFTVVGFIPGKEKSEISFEEDLIISQVKAALQEEEEQEKRKKEKE